MAGGVWGGAQVAGQVAVVHEMVERLRSEWDSRTGQDPFEVGGQAHTCKP